MALDPEALDAWGLKPIPPSLPIADDEIGLTADEDGGWDEPNPGPAVTELLRALATFSLCRARYWLIRSNLFRTRWFRWRT